MRPSGVVQENGFYIGGTWVIPKGRKRFETVNPATGATLGAFPLGTSEDVNAAVRTAKALPVNGLCACAQGTNTVGARVLLLAQPGMKWIYSQIGYAILGRLIEVCSGQSYEEYLAEHLFLPLGMKDTYFFLPAEKQSRQAVLYTLDASGKLVRTSRSPEPVVKVPTPEGGALSTVTDMARFYQMLMNKGTLNGKRILSAAAVEAMTTNQTGDLKNVEFSPGLGMGLSFGVGTCILMTVVPLPDFVPHPIVSLISIIASILTLSLITVTAGMYPAQRAAEMTPVESLRYE